MEDQKLAMTHQSPKDSVGARIKGTIRPKILVINI